jgi:RHS repeat-associated protein
LTSETYPSLRVVTTTYDAANRPVTLSGTYGGHGTNYVTGTAYWANGGITALTRGNNLIYGESYNNREQLTGITEKHNSANVWSLGLNWGNAGTNNGTLQGATTVGSGLTFAQTFGYDNLNRLSAATEGSNWAQSYAYDAWGNVWMPASSLPAPVTGPSMPTANVYSASGPGNNRNVNSTYDAAGNLTVFGAVSVSYDAENRQKAAGSTIYLYDGLGQRLGKTTPGNTAYVYDAFGWLAEGLTLGYPWQQDYIRFGGELLAVENNTAFTVQPPCATCYLSYDHLGSVRMVTDGSANVMAFHDYAPFGQEIPAGVGGRTALWGGSDSASERFTGQMRDTESGLDFFNARYLSSGVGRFMSADPGNAGAVGADPQTWNGYGYVRNTPGVLVDPSGMADCSSPQYPGTLACVQNAPLGGPVTTSTQDGQSTNGLPILTPGGNASKFCLLCWVKSFHGGAAAPAKSVAQRLSCAATFGDNHSIAAAFGTQDTFIGQFLGGNTVSGLIDIGLNISGYSSPSAGDLAQVALGGAGQGLPPLHGESGIQTLFDQGAQIGSHSAGWDGAAGIAVDNIVEAGTAAAARVLPAAAVGRVASLGLKAANVAAYGQLALDLSTTAYGYFFACR